MKLKTIVFFSGNGSNLQVLIDHSQQNLIPINIIKVVTNNPLAGGIQRAEDAGIPTLIFPMSKVPKQTREEYDLALLQEINKQPYDLIILAGFMLVLGPNFLKGLHSQSQIINLHPALPNTFIGKNGIQDAWKAYQDGRVKETGVMVHYVIPEMDAGEVIAKQVVPIYPTDTFESLQERVRYYEKPLLLQAVQLVYKKFYEKTPLIFNLTTPYKQGKVRDIYDVGYNLLLMVQTDRQSAFDRHICQIEGKGRILTHASRWWFNQTSHIINNHFLHAEGNMMLVKKATPIPIEVVVRGYMTGSTKTSLWTHYQQDPKKPYCGIQFAEGIKKNEQLQVAVVTPTTKSDTGDELLTPQEIVEKKIMTEEGWSYVSQKALNLFRFGQMVAQVRNLILVDTKYEFGRLPTGEIILIDEIHTCDSSRYWKLDTYQKKFEAGEEPDKYDKDIVREYIKSQTQNPYEPNPLPEIPQSIMEKASSSYHEFYGQLTMEQLPEEYPRGTIENRLVMAKGYLEEWHSPVVVILAGSETDTPFVEKTRTLLRERNIYSIYHVASAHRNTQLVLEILKKYQGQYDSRRRKIVFLTVAGKSNALSGVVAANTKLPVIALPPFSDKMDMMVNVNSSLQCPSGVPVLTILEPSNAVLAIERIFSL